MSSGKTQSEIEEVLGLNTSITSGLFHKWKPYVITALVIALPLVFYSLWSSGGAGKTLRYVTEQVGRNDLVVVVTATGSVQPTNTVDISSELSGTIRRVHVDYNHNVKVGQQLAELDTDKLKASVESAKARLAAAKSKVKNAEATVVEKRLDYQRKTALVEKNVVSQLNLEIAKAAYERALAAVDSAKADVAAAEADLKLNETNLAKTCICSPINGIVLSRNIEPGQTVASTLQAPVLFSIAEDLTKMEIQVDVDEADVGKVKEKQKAIFTVDAYPDKKFTAIIRELRFGSEVVQGVVTYKAILTTDNSNLLLRPGMTATAEIIVKEVKSAVTVPNSALRFTPPEKSKKDSRSLLQKILPGRPRLRPPSANVDLGIKRTVWILVNGKPERVEVEIGSSDGTRTQITSGNLKPGQRVIVDTTTSNS